MRSSSELRDLAVVFKGLAVACAMLAVFGLAIDPHLLTFIIQTSLSVVCSAVYLSIRRRAIVQHRKEISQI
jgi:hypothetical protein